MIIGGIFVLEGLLVDDVDQRRDYGRLELFDGFEQRLDPALGHLDVRVEEDEHLTLRSAGTAQSTAYESFSLFVADHSDLFTKVILQIGVQWCQ